MHSSIVLALFAAGALAQPVEQRDVVVQTMTAFTTVTVGGPAPTANAAPAAPAAGGDDDGWTLVQPGSGSGSAKVGAQGGHGHAHVHAGSSGAGSSGKSAVAADGGIDTSGADRYQNIVLTHHNVHRANHSAPALVWSDEMASAAEEWANHCTFEHHTDGYGQNIAAGVTADRVSEAITGMFYNNEVPYFNGLYGLPDPTAGFESWGHFSQLVWKGTTSVGCFTKHCPQGVTNADGTSDFTVCNYSPAGNVGGAYGQNIGDSLGKPTVDPDYALSQL